MSTIIQKNLYYKFGSFYKYLIWIFIELFKSRLIYLILLNIIVSCSFFFLDFPLNYKIFMFFGVLSPTFLLLALKFPELILIIYIIIGRGYSLRLFQDSDIPIFQYPIWIWIAMVSSIWVYLLKKETKIFLKDFKWISLLLIWSILSLLWSPNILFGISKSIHFFMAFTVLISAYILVTHQQKVDWILKLIFLFSILYLIAIFLNTIYGRGLNVLGFDKNRFGRFLVISFPLIGLIFEKGKNLWYVIFSLGIILSGSRSALLGFIISLFIGIFITRIFSYKRLFSLILIFFITFYVLSILKDISPLTRYQYYKFLDKILFRNIGNRSFYGIFENLDPYRSAYLLEFLIDLVYNLDKYLLGLGIGGYTYKYYEMFGIYISRGYPHFFIAEVYYELGLIGLLIFSFFVKDVLFKKKKYREDILFILESLAVNATIFLIIAESLDDVYTTLFYYGLLMGYRKYLKDYSKNF